MAHVTLTYVEDQDDGLQHNQTVTISRDNVEDLHELLDFLSDAVRASGYTQYTRLGVATEKGATTWSTF
jgi:hypothetical protein